MDVCVMYISQHYGKIHGFGKPKLTRAELWGTASTFNKCSFFTLSNKFQIPVNFVFIYFSNTG